MKQKIILLCGLLFITQTSYAIKLNEQIKQNVDNAAKSYQQLINKEPARLWIHVRSEQQLQLLQSIAVWLKPMSSLKVEPMKIVKEGPKKTQLRFFSKLDKEDAGELLKKLQNFFPQLELQDMSSEYQGMDWITMGHYELWLASEVKEITQPPASTPNNAR
jgi:hypothetical protein